MSLHVAVQEADCFSSSDRRAVEKALLRWRLGYACQNKARSGSFRKYGVFWGPYNKDPTI